VWVQFGFGFIGFLTVAVFQAAYASENAVYVKVKLSEIT
jgi:hypothetical protein